VLEDATLLNTDRSAFDAVFAPKIAGAWNLHVATRGVPLDFFVLFSSAAAVLGSGGQGNYAAANAFLDALAHQRRRAGLPAVSIDFGAFRDAGLAARESGRGERLEDTGLPGLSIDEGMSIVASLAAGSVTQVLALRLDRARWVERYPRLA